MLEAVSEGSKIPRRRSAGRVDSVGFVSKKIRECNIPICSKQERDAQMSAWLNEYHDDCTTRLRQQELTNYIIMNVWHLFPFTAAHQRFSKDLFEEALQNLTQSVMRAIDRFDPERGVKFTSYILGYLKEAISTTHRQAWVVDFKKNKTMALGPIMSMSDTCSPSSRGRSSYPGQYGSGGSSKELTLEETISIKDVAHNCANQQEMFQEDPEQHVINNELLDILLEMLADGTTLLSEQERCVIKYRFGIAGTPKMTLDEISRKVFENRGWRGGKVWVHQIEQRARLKMKKYLQDRGVYSSL